MSYTFTCAKWRKNKVHIYIGFIYNLFGCNSQGHRATVIMCVGGGGGSTKNLQKEGQL